MTCILLLTPLKHTSRKPSLPQPWVLTSCQRQDHGNLFVGTSNLKISHTTSHTTEEYSSAPEYHSLLLPSSLSEYCPHICTTLQYPISYWRTSTPSPAVMGLSPTASLFKTCWYHVKIPVQVLLAQFPSPSSHRKDALISHYYFFSYKICASFLDSSILKTEFATQISIKYFNHLSNRDSLHSQSHARESRAKGCFTCCFCR